MEIKLSQNLNALCPTDLSKTLMNGKYEILSCLGKGGFGEVYEVRERLTGNKFAAKKMRIDEVDDLEVAMAEIILFNNQYIHPNIVSVVEHFKTENEFVFIMELGICNLKQEIEKIKLTKKGKKEEVGVAAAVIGSIGRAGGGGEGGGNKDEAGRTEEGGGKKEDGGRRRVEEESRNRIIFSFAQMLKVLKDILSALLFTTSKNVHYGDLKPTNVIKFDDGYKITDWGTASIKQMGVDKTVTVKSNRLIVGTLLYMAPELQTCLENDINLSIVGNKNKYKVRINFEKADVFSLGLLILEVYFNFSKTNLRKIKQKIQLNLYSPKEINELLLRTGRKEAPNAFFLLVATCLSFNHVGRPKFREILMTLEKFEGGGGGGGGEGSINAGERMEEYKEEELTEKFRKRSHEGNSTYEDENLSITELLKKKANHIDNIEYQVNTLRKINHKSNKYSSLKFLRWNKFLDFELNPELLALLQNSTRYKILSVSGKSGVGKSTTMNLLVNILTQYDKLSIPAEELKYTEIFKVGDGMHGTTDGLDFNIVKIDSENSLIVIDLQGNNDKRMGKQWKFLYFSLFYTVFLISDFHFYFYDGNLEDIEQSELKTVVEEKERTRALQKEGTETKVWSRSNELILVKKFDKKGLKGAKLQSMVREHASKASFVYDKKVFKGRGYFCRQNEHFDSLEEENCLNEGRICNDCRESDCLKTVMEIADYLINPRDPFEKRTGLEVLEDLHYILKEVHERRYLICMQVGKDLIEEYLSHAAWCYQLKCEKIAKYDFVSVFKRLFGNNFFAENPLDENRLQQIDKLARNFGQIYLISIEFRKFIENNLDEHGNNILKKQEVEFLHKVFLGKFEEYYRDFIYLLKFYLESPGFSKEDFGKTIKSRLQDIYTSIKAKKISEKVELKVSFCDLLFKKNKREGFIYYLLLNEDSIQEIMKNELMDNDKFEYTHAICGLKFAELLIGVDIKSIIALEKNMDILIINTKNECIKLKEEVNRRGFGKNKEVVKILYRIKKILEDFINQHETKLKILLD